MGIGGGIFLIALGAILTAALFGLLADRKLPHSAKVVGAYIALTGAVLVNLLPTWTLLAILSLPVLALTVCRDWRLPLVGHEVVPKPCQGGLT